MNFHEKKEIPPKYIYLFLTVICLLLLLFSVLFENRFSPLKTVTSTIITPMQSGINHIGCSIYNQVVDKKEKDTLLLENKELAAKVDEYSAQLKVYEQENYELKRLQELLELKEQYSDFETTAARVIAKDSNNWFSTFIIDKGKEDGVKVDCNILAGGGLVGIVTEVGADYAKVRAIIDDNSKISATVTGSTTLCTVSGDLTSFKDGYINVGHLNKSDKIKEGAELVTSHISDKFLPGLLIGYITEVELDSNNLTKSAKCIPVVDFSNLQEVLVVMELKENYKAASTNKNIYDNVVNDTEQTKNSEAGSNENTSTESSTTSEEADILMDDENALNEDTDNGE